MKRILSTLLLIVSSLCISMITMAQDFPSLREKAENTIKTKRREMKLFRKQEKENEVVYQWGSQDDGVRLLVFYGTYPQETSEKMKAYLKFIPVSSDKELADIGEEAYFWKDDRTGFAAVRFRKSNVYIDLVAPSADMAKDLAKGLAQEIEINRPKYFR